MLISRFGIGNFLGGDVASDFIFFFFLGMCIYGVTLAPVTPYKTDISVRIFSTIIYFGAGASDWKIKSGALVTFCVLIYSVGNSFSPEIGATNFSFASFPLSIDDSESLGYSSSQLAIISLFGVTGSFHIGQFDLLVSNGTTHVLYGSISWPSISLSSFLIEVRFKCGNSSF